jgi:preprotein translocase subunit SecD
VDTSAPPNELSAELTVSFVAGDIERRILRFGGYDILIEEGEGSLIRAEFNGITLEEAVLLLGQQANFEFREPVIEDDGRVTCQSSDGAHFLAAKDTIVVNETDPATATCGEGSRTGLIQWQATTWASPDGQTIKLTGRYIREAQYVEQNGNPYVSIDFAPEAAIGFEQVTTRLTGYPLAFFLDGELIAAPTVIVPISN